MKDLQRTEVNYKIKVIPVRLTKIEDVNQLLPEVLRTADAVYVTGSNLVDSQVVVIAEMATKAKVITITHLEDLVEKGVLLGVCADAYAMGRLAGEKAVKILKGVKPASIPIESAKKMAPASKPEKATNTPKPVTGIKIVTNSGKKAECPGAESPRTGSPQALQAASAPLLPGNASKKSDVILNMKTAKKGQFQIPPNLMKTVTRTIE